MRSRLQWAGHVERMADDRLPKRAAELREQGRRRRGRPRLRWEDCVKRDVRKAGEEEDWKKKTRDRGGWKRLSDEAVKKVAGSTSPLTKGNEEEREINKTVKAVTISIKRRLRQNGMLIKILKYKKKNMYYCIQDIYCIYIYNISMPIQYTMEK